MEDRASAAQMNKSMTADDTAVVDNQQGHSKKKKVIRNYRGGEEEFAQMRKMYADEKAALMEVEVSENNAMAVGDDSVQDNITDNAHPISPEKVNTMDIQISNIQGFVTETENTELKDNITKDVEMSDPDIAKKTANDILLESSVANQGKTKITNSGDCEIGGNDKQTNDISSSHSGESENHIILKGSDIGDNMVNDEVKDVQSTETNDELANCGGEKDENEHGKMHNNGSKNNDVIIGNKIKNSTTSDVEKNDFVKEENNGEGGKMRQSAMTLKDNTAEKVLRSGDSSNRNKSDDEMNDKDMMDSDDKNDKTVDNKTQENVVISKDEGDRKSTGDDIVVIESENDDTKMAKSPTSKECEAGEPQAAEVIYPREAGLLADDDDLLILIKDTDIPIDGTDPERAMKTLPDSLTIRDSDHMTGKGVFCAEFLPEGVSFGPYEGEIVQATKAIDTKYCWKIYMKGRLKHYLDSRDEARSNWMRYVQFTDGPNHNLVPRQYQGHIYYGTTKEIHPGTELLLQTNMAVASKNDSVKTRKPRTRKSKSRLSTAREKALDFGNNVVVLDETSYECPTCNLCVSTYSDLQEHLESHMDQKKPHICSHCHKAFPSPSLLVTHVRVHTGEKPFTCKICSRGFNQAGNMRQHMKTHHGKLKFFKCENCPQEFSSLRELKQHIRETHEFRNFICQICGKGFKEQQHLRMHERVHDSAMEKLVCPVCKLQFPSRDILLDHMHLHT